MCPPYSASDSSGHAAWASTGIQDSGRIFAKRSSERARTSPLAATALLHRADFGGRPTTPSGLVGDLGSHLSISCGTTTVGEYAAGMLGPTVAEAARRFGDQTAYVVRRPGGDWADALHVSYRDLDRISDEVAAALGRRGVGFGDRVGLVFAPGVEYVIAYLALAKLGAVTAGVNDRLSASERQAVLAQLDPILVLTHPGCEPHNFAAETIDRATSVETLFEAVREVGATVPGIVLDADADAAIIFTSGTTGQPKGARYSNRQLQFITKTDVGETWGTGGRNFTGTSFAHLGFMTKLPGNLRRGGTSFIVERWRPDDALQLLSTQRMTMVAGVPTQFAMMLNDPHFDGFDLSSVQYIITGGGPITVGLAQECRQRFDAKLQTRYSCTEAGIGLGTAFDDPLLDAVVSIGRPHPGVSLAIRDNTDPQRPDDVAIGDIGEVCLRSDACMRGYWNDPQATAAAFTSDGFVRTGDLGYIDDAGRVRLVGRSKEMYVRGGYNVYPVEVECILSEHPSVASVVVVPRNDAVMGEIGVACVVVRDGAEPPTLEALRSLLIDRVARYKAPEALALVTSFPLTAMDKIDRAALRQKVTDSATPR